MQLDKRLWFLIVGILVLSVPHQVLTMTHHQSHPLQGVDLGQMRLINDTYQQQMEDGRVIVFTPNAQLQGFSDNLLQKYDVPAGAVVVLNSRTGRVLAFSSHVGESYAAEHAVVPLDASPPAASIFKIVTTAALLEETDVNLNSSVCYHGGGGGLYAHHLQDNPERDKACRSLKKAFGFSTNCVYAKLADRHLDPAEFQRYASRFGFGKPLPFDVNVPISAFELPPERLERARTAAGFWHSHLSPLHGAAIVQSIAQGGAMLRPYIVDHVADETGAVIYQSSPQFIGRTVEATTAKKLIDAMSVTVSQGTARRGFVDSRGQSMVPGATVAGKTGTLHGKAPFRAYNWFVGLAPVDNPEVAIAVLIVNTPKWRIKSSWTAAQVLQQYFSKK